MGKNTFGYPVNLGLREYPLPLECGSDLGLLKYT